MSVVEARRVRKSLNKPDGAFGRLLIVERRQMTGRSDRRASPGPGPLPLSPKPACNSSSRRMSLIRFRFDIQILFGIRFKQIHEHVKHCFAHLRLTFFPLYVAPAGQRIYVTFKLQQQKHGGNLTCRQSAVFDERVEQKPDPSPLRSSRRRYSGSISSVQTGESIERSIFCSIDAAMTRQHSVPSSSDDILHRFRRVWRPSGSTGDSRG